MAIQQLTDTEMGIVSTKITEKGNKGIIRFVPLFFIFSYPILVVLDNYTTYLASPDLKYEQNPIVVYFSMGWSEIILWQLCVVLFSILFVLLTNKILIDNLINKTRENHKIWIWLIIIIYIMFIEHYIGSIYASISNYLSYIYLNGTNNASLRIFAQKHIEFTKLLIPYFCYVLFNAMLYILASAIFILRVRYLKRRYAPTHLPTRNPSQHR